jgi:hypothetical protein
MPSNATLVALIVCAAAGLPGPVFGQQTKQTNETPQNGIVSFATAPPNQIVSLHTKLIVPPLPAAAGTLFLWPGLQPTPDGAHYMPIDNGVLQSVLSWGPSCAPGKQPDPYSTWWISSQYVNTVGYYSGYTDCLGGPIMAVDVGDILAIDFSFSNPFGRKLYSTCRTGNISAFISALQTKRRLLLGLKSNHMTALREET